MGEKLHNTIVDPELSGIVLNRAFREKAIQGLAKMDNVTRTIYEMHSPIN